MSSKILVFFIFFFLFVSFVSLQQIIFATNAFAQASSLEVTCRSKAKETAVNLYNDCMTEARQEHIQEIRQEYQAKLKELKSFYDDELKKIAVNPAKQNSINANQYRSPQKPKVTLQKRKKSGQRQSLKPQQNQIPTQLPEKEVSSLVTSTNQGAQNQIEERAVEIPSPQITMHDKPRSRRSNSEQQVDQQFGNDEVVDLSEQ